MQRLIGALVLMLVADPALADTQTKWMTEKQLHQHVAGQMSGGKAYGVVIECSETRGKAVFRMTKRKFDGTPPFHRWQWVHGAASKLGDVIGALRLKSRPELKYRIVQRHDYYDGKGRKMSCALLYR
ncbi:hypothetical protein RXV86_07085 [Alisedimentitalea sp. MJ-SS2]|uniref:hypothetical protein n=1 Tax=Aliisedimentitalea sp. MJ-SS2 TaxID=3049795 RepID=UPI002914DE86|nr:hypothetical protein [Alisedimentitalea sp. MJ-SS2]MDU8927144.1 hypothetical protein [Alisedimentitalea sp. MJ-SS2]